MQVQRCECFSTTAVDYCKIETSVHQQHYLLTSSRYDKGDLCNDAENVELVCCIPKSPLL